MLTDPSKIVFESTNDVVDYVSRGFVPSRKNFERVMLAVRVPTPDGVIPEKGTVSVPERLFINCDNNTMNAALQRVYENRVRNRNIGIGIMAGIVIAGLVFGGKSSCKKHKDDTNGMIDQFEMDIDFPDDF